MSFDTNSLTNFVLIQLYVNGTLLENGRYLAMLSEDGHTIRWSRPVSLFLFTMEHLCSITGSKYLDSNIRVRLFDKVTQAIFKDKNKLDANENYLGKPQEIHLKKRCTGMPKTVAIPYKSP
jgi:hypothetical protein